MDVVPDVAGRVQLLESAWLMRRDMMFRTPTSVDSCVQMSILRHQALLGVPSCKY